MGILQVHQLQCLPVAIGAAELIRRQGTDAAAVSISYISAVSTAR